MPPVFPTRLDHAGPIRAHRGIKLFNGGGIAKSVKLTWRSAAAIAVAVILVAFAIEIFLVPSVSPQTAEHALLSPPFSFAGEHGQPIARCHRTGLFSLGSDDQCTLTFASGDVYRCTVSPPQDQAGIDSSCAVHPVRRRNSALSH
jgi:hypothetical protein